MGLNIEELLKLNRLRDSKIEGTGVKRTVEICRNPDKLLKGNEDYVYETVEVVDGAFVDEKGIVDEIVRMTFHDDEYERSLNNHIHEGGKTIKKYGFYLRYKNTDAHHPFDLLFRKTEKAYMNKLKSNSGIANKEEFFAEDHRSHARLQVFEMISGNNEEFNRLIRKKFNIDITNIDDFKIMLLDNDLSKSIQQYMTTMIANSVTIKSQRGRNEDYIFSYKIENGVREKEVTRVRKLYLDKKYNDNEEEDGYTFIKMQDGVYEDDDNVDRALTIEDEETLIKEGNLFTYIINNLNSIFTEKQADYLKAYLNNKENEYLSSVSSSEYLIGSNRHKYKSHVSKSIMQHLEQCTYAIKKEDKFEFRETLLVSLESILSKTSKREIFIELCKHLQNEKTVTEKVLIDIVYGLEPKYYMPIVDYIVNNRVSNMYIEKDFDVVIEELQKAYVWHSNNNNVVFNINKNDKELQVDKFMKKILGDKKEGIIAKNSGYEYVSMKQFRKFFSNICETKITIKELNSYLNKFGYCITDTVTSFNKMTCYKVYVLGHEPRKNKVTRDYNAIREIKLNKTQINKIEKYLDKNLQFDKLIISTKYLDYLTNKELLDFIEDEVSVKKITKRELAYILKQCSYELNCGSNSVTIDGIKYSANKLTKTSN